MRRQLPVSRPSRTKGRTIMPYYQWLLLEVDGQPAGRLLSSTPDYLSREITITCGPGMSQAFYRWIGDTLAGHQVRKNAAVVTMNSSNRPVLRNHIANGLISSVEFPAVSKYSTEAGHMKISIRAEKIWSVQAFLSNGMGVYGGVRS